jgi:hypothetical protein
MDDIISVGSGDESDNGDLDAKSEGDADVSPMPSDADVPVADRPTLAAPRKRKRRELSDLPALPVRRSTRLGASLDTPYVGAALCISNHIQAEAASSAISNLDAGDGEARHIMPSFTTESHLHTSIAGHQDAAVNSPAGSLFSDYNQERNQYNGSPDAPAQDDHEARQDISNRLHSMSLPSEDLDPGRLSDHDIDSFMVKKEDLEGGTMPIESVSPRVEEARPFRSPSAFAGRTYDHHSYTAVSMEASSVRSNSVGPSPRYSGSVFGEIHEELQAQIDEHIQDIVNSGLNPIRLQYAQ